MAQPIPDRIERELRGTLPTTLFYDKQGGH